jgi:hypothetical protein
MSQPHARTYAVASGPIYGGVYAGGRFTGVLALGNESVSGAYASNASAFTGALALDDATVSGAMTGYVLPAWLTGKPLNEWFQIAGTSGAGGAAATAFSGMALRDDTSEIFIPAAGGHLDSSDNRVVSIDLRQDSPTWTTRAAASASVTADAAYNPDGKPASRHTYHSTHWCAPRNRIILSGAEYVYGGGVVTYNTVDGFNATTNTWDAAATFANIPSACYGAAVDNSGNILSVVGFRKWTQSSDTYSAAISPPGDATTQVRRPWCYDSLRDQWFGLAWGDGQGFTGWGSTIRAVKMSNTGLTQVAVTLNASAARTQLEADQPAYAGMCYDVTNDRFLFYAGMAGREGTVYVITPNAGTAWDVSILSLGGGSITPATVDGAGVNARFRYVPALKGVVLLATTGANLYFLRTA